jgi:hypothetical protein
VGGFASAAAARAQALLPPQLPRKRRTAEKLQRHVAVDQAWQVLRRAGAV